jgi:hypothetical protein
MGDDRLEELWATHEIGRLAHRYAYAMNFRERDLMFSLWAETDERVEYPSYNLRTVRRDVDRWMGIGPSVLFVGNHLIDFEDGFEAARGTVYCLAQVDFGGRFVDQSIVYQDRYVRRDGHWLFDVRRHLLWFGQERERNPLEQPPADWPRDQVGRGTLPEELERR